MTALTPICRHEGEGGRARLDFSADARVAIAHLGVAAKRHVATGTTMHFGGWLGWPDWLRDGTSLTGSGPLPKVLTAADDLTIIANVLEHEGDERILHRVLYDIRQPIGPLAALALANAPTLGDALSAIARLTNILRTYFRATVCGNDGRMQLALTQNLPDSRLADVVGLIILFVGYRTVASYVGEIDKRIELRCRMSASKVVDELTCRHQVGADENSLTIPIDVAGIANELADPGLWRLAQEQMAAQERRQSEPDAVLKVRRHIAHAINEERRTPRMKEMTSGSMSERTLARMLAAHGTTFHSMVDEERRQRAAQLINNPALSLSDIAAALGFTDMSSFGRSFRSWFGTAPGKLRRDVATDVSAS